MLGLFSSIKLYFYLGLAVLFSYLSYSLYQKEQELSGYRVQVVQLEANNSILKGNLDSMHNTLESLQLQYDNYRELHSAADSEVVELHKKNAKLDKQNTEFSKEIINIKKELDIAEAKLLEYQIPDAIIDAYNANSMHNAQVTTL
ncbi:hypothetical protein G6Z94_18760 [Vibrio aestuarianus]|uniref:hypothetical protein n=1 Tax=Vibrio aestuarianus TaxID=28171 RepID=UPI0015938F66|nr:hypothetical protein [Vibrio aestuarianus]NGZ19313.1 hypothetical protein [Vibrio aestuarianus]